MRLRRVETLDILGQNREIHLPAGQYAGVMLRFHGTAAEGETPILADFGTILHRFRGRAIMNARAA